MDVENNEEQVSEEKVEVTSETVSVESVDSAESKESVEPVESKDSETVLEENPVDNNNDNKSKKEKKNKKEKKEKKPFDPKKIGLKIQDSYDKIQSNIPVYIFVCVFSLVVLVLAAIGTFFANIKGPEQVLVPNVVGKSLEDALLEMQVKELYPKINLRYSEVSGDEGTILEQSPEAGAIVKGYSRVSLVVSRGIIVDKLGNYVGQNYDDVRMNIQTMFAGQTKPLIILATPQYKPDLSEAGTILEQDPPEGTEISEPVTVNLIVSRGPNYENTKAPWVKGQSVNDLLQTIARSKIVFDITSHVAAAGEKAGTVVSQDTFDSDYVPNYTRVAVEMALPEGTVNDNVYGIFTDTLIAYPYPVPMKLEAIPAEGDSYTILNFVHPGGLVTIPYAVPKGTTLVLSVVDKEISRKSVN